MKTTSSKSRKIGIFPKGLVHGFGQKLVFFPDFYFSENSQTNVFYDILEGRNAFLHYENKKLKTSKNWYFPKVLVDGFGQKLVIFPDFYFRKK